MAGDVSHRNKEENARKLDLENASSKTKDPVNAERYTYRFWNNVYSHPDNVFSFMHMFQQRSPWTVEHLELCIRQEREIMSLSEVRQLLSLIPKLSLKGNMMCHSGKHPHVTTVLECVAGIIFK